MAHQNKVQRSLETPDGGRCVDIFRRPDGTFGFEEFRRDMEDGRGWFAIGDHGGRRFSSQDDTLAAALVAVSWLVDVVSSDGGA